MENPTVTLAPETPATAERDGTATPVATPVAGTPAVENEMLVEEISIDGMCGVY